MTPRPGRRRPDVEPLDGTRCTLGEGGRWDGADYTQVDLLAGRALVSAGARGPLQQVIRLDEPLGSVTPATGGRLLVAGTGAALLPDGAPVPAGPGDLRRLVAPVAGADPARRVNDSAVLPGHCWFGTMDDAGTAGRGALWRLDSDGSVRRVLDGLGCPNGPAVSPDGRTLVLADTTAAVIHRFTVADDGELVDGRLLAEVDPSHGGPDGMTVDDAGELWVALWDGAAVARFDAGGTLVELLELPVRRPTSVTIADGRMLVTSARHGLADPGPLDGATLVLATAATAPPVARFRLGDADPAAG